MTQRARVRMLIQSVIDAGIGVTMFLAAYWLRFETGLIPAPKGQPPFAAHLQLAPFIGILLPFGLWLQGAYRHERIRSRVDDFFAVLIGGLIAGVLGLAGTLVVQAYFIPRRVEGRGPSTRCPGSSGGCSCCSPSSSPTRPAPASGRRSSSSGARAWA